MKFKNTLITIILSRTKPKTAEKWIEERTRICNTCPNNTANMSKISFKQKVSRFFSNLLTVTMTGKFNGSNAECGICTCTLEYKIPEPTEYCPKDKWKSIYLPNSAQKTKKQWN